MRSAAFPYLWVACLCLAGCAVAEYPYPLAWQPLVSQPESDCREFQGRFADRGEGNDEAARPSLTRELFGEFSDWENAKTVQLAMPKEGVLEISVANDAARPFFSRTFRKDKDFSCRGGRLIVHSRRWIAGYVMSGRQLVDLELNGAGSNVIVQVEEFAYGVMFVIFPVIGTARHWYRFQRLA